MTAAAASRGPGARTATECITWRQTEGYLRRRYRDIYSWFVANLRARALNTKPRTIVWVDTICKEIKWYATIVSISPWEGYDQIAGLSRRELLLGIWASVIVTEIVESSWINERMKIPKCLLTMWLPNRQQTIKLKIISINIF